MQNVNFVKMGVELAEHLHLVFRRDIDRPFMHSHFVSVFPFCPACRLRFREDL